MKYSIKIVVLLDVTPCSLGHGYRRSDKLAARWRYQVPPKRRDVYTKLHRTVVVIPPFLWSSGQSSWLHNGDVLCFL
jgi:hypothetical protein